MTKRNLHGCVMDSDLNNKLKQLEINDVNNSEDKVSMGMKGSKRAKKNVLVLEDEAQPDMTKTVASMLPVPNTEFVEQYSHVAGCSNEKPLIVYQDASVTDCDKISVVSQSSQKENGISNQNLDTALILEERVSYNSKQTKSDTSVNVDTNHGLCIISALVEDDNRNVLGNDTKQEDNTHKDPNNRQKANDQKNLGEANQEDNDCQQDSKLVAKSCPDLETKTYSFLSNQNVSVKEIQDTGACRENVNKEKKNTFYAIHSLEKALMAMNAENKDWNQSVIDLSKCTRTTYKTHPKEVVTVLVKHQIVDKFITFIKANNVEFLAKLKPNEIDSMKCWPSFKRILNLFWILCDSSVNFCQYTLNSKVFEYLMMELRVLSAVSHSLNERSLYLLKAILGLFHNITRHIPSSKWVFRNEGLVSILRIFLNCDEAMVRVKALIILSYITSETENEIINSDDENFQFIILVLSDSLSSANHTSLKYGMNSLEVLKGLCNLAVNDENKIRIVKNGVLPLYEHCLEVGNKEEKKLVITSLWSLAFHHYNKQKMRDSKGLMQKLRALESPVEFADDDEICHAARGAVWELENVSAASIDRNYSSSTEKDSQLPHIMISYQWDSQSIMVKVKDKLRQAGYKVWMDVEHMTGSTLEAMALAVERAAVVLICMSQKYKDSPNCRTEAEYVYRLRKDFVPLRLQQDYLPDGWLGIMIGTRLYFDVHSEEIIDLQIPRLVKELRDRGKINPIFDSVDQGMIVPTRMLSREAAPLLASRSTEVIAWTQGEVCNWLAASGCEELIERLPPLDGQLLSELQHIQGRAPEFFYNVLKSELNLNVTEILKFSKCLRNVK